MLELRDRNGDVVLLAVVWVEMADESTAREFRTLLDTPGSGNFAELSREGARYRFIRYSTAAYASRQDGAVVINAQAQPVVGGRAGLALTSIVTTAVEDGSAT